MAELGFQTPAFSLEAKAVPYTLAAFNFGFNAIAACESTAINVGRIHVLAFGLDSFNSVYVYPGFDSK